MSMLELLDSVDPAVRSQGVELGKALADGLGCLTLREALWLQGLLQQANAWAVIEPWVVSDPQQD